MAQRVIVEGKNFTLSIFKVDNYYPIACIVDMELWEDEDYDDTSTPDSGVFVTLAAANRKQWGVNLNLVTVLRDLNDVMWFSWEFFLELVRNAGVDIKLTATDKSAYSKNWTGHVKIGRTTMAGKAGEVSNSTIQLLGSGPLSPPDPLIITVSKVERLEWLIDVEAGTRKVTHPYLFGKAASQVKEVSHEGDDKYRVITAGDPAAGQVKLDNVNNTFEFPFELEALQFVWALVE
jgi:hypothetical protein